MAQSAAEFIRKSIRHNNTSLHNVDKTPNFPCGICNFEVKHNDKSILCTECDKWAHIRCTEVSVAEYREMQQRNRENPDLIETESWKCIKCIMDERAIYNPFVFLTSNQLTNMNTVDTMKIYDMLPEENVFSEALKNNSEALRTNCLNINDADTNEDELNEDLIDHINCKYFTCD